jgi:hypothetical protein
MKFIRKFPVADADSLESPQKFEGFFLDYYPRVKGFINGLLQDAEEADICLKEQKIFRRIYLCHCGRTGEI